MEKISLKKSASLALIEYFKWICDARMFVILILLVFLKFYSVDPLLTNAEKMNAPLNLFEPFIAVANSGLIMLILPLVFMVLIADYPKVDTNTVFYISRVGRTNWLISQVIKLVLMILSYILVVFLGTVIPVISHCFIGNRWSSVVLEFNTKYPELRESFGAALLPENLYYQHTFMTTIVGSYLLVFAYLFIIGMIMLMFTVINKKEAGFLVSGIVVGLGTAACAIDSFIMWLFPMANSIIWIHYTKYFREPELSMSYSIAYLIVVALILIAGSFIMIGDMNYNSISEVEN